MGLDDIEFNAASSYTPSMGGLLLNVSTFPSISGNAHHLLGAHANAVLMNTAPVRGFRTAAPYFLLLLIPLINFPVKTLDKYFAFELRTGNKY
jgi:hypothetical protein